MLSIYRLVNWVFDLTNTCTCQRGCSECYDFQYWTKYNIWQDILTRLSTFDNRINPVRFHYSVKFAVQIFALYPFVASVCFVDAWYWTGTCHSWRHSSYPNWRQMKTYTFQCVAMCLCLPRSLQAHLSYMKSVRFVAGTKASLGGHRFPSVFTVSHYSRLPITKQCAKYTLHAVLMLGTNHPEIMYYDNH